MNAQAPLRNALRTGLRRAIRSRGMILLLYAVSFLSALPLALGFRSAALSVVGSSRAPEVLLQGFDLTVIGDFLKSGGAAVTGVMGTVFPATILFLLLSAVLSGGVYASLRSTTENWTAASFLSACGRYAGRLLRLLCLSLLMYLAVAALLLIAGGAIAHSLTKDAVGEDTVILAQLAVGGVAACALYFLSLCIDYARVDIVLRDRRSIVQAVREGARFLLRRPLSGSAPPVVGLFLLALAAVAYLILEDILPAGTPGSIVLVVLLQQLFMLVRALLKVLVSGIIVAYYEYPHAANVYVPAWDRPPAD